MPMAPGRGAYLHQLAVWRAAERRSALSGKSPPGLLDPNPLPTVKSFQNLPISCLSKDKAVGGL